MYVELPPLHCVVVVLEGGHKRKATARMLDWAEGKARPGFGGEERSADEEACWPIFFL
jgi:hypothetical protein